MAELWEEECFEEEGEASAVWAEREWVTEEEFEDGNGLSVVLRSTEDMMQVVVSPPPPTAHIYKALFDNQRLDDAGFRPRMAFEKRVKLVIAALKGERALSVTLEHSGTGMNLVLHLPLKQVLLPLKRAKLKTSTDRKLTESAEMPQTIEGLKQRLEATEVELGKAKESLRDAMKEIAILKTQAAAERRVCDQKLAAANEYSHELESLLAKAKAQAAAERRVTDKTLADLRAKIRVRDDAHIGDRRIEDKVKVKRVGHASIDELPKKKICPTAASSSITIVKKPTTDFCFDTRMRTGFVVSGNRKSATVDTFWAQVLLTPSVTSDCRLTLAIVKMTGAVAVGLTDDSAKSVFSWGCRFHSDGSVRVNGSSVTFSAPFGGWNSGDRLVLKTHLSSGTVCIQSPNGEFTAEWRPRSKSFSFVVFCAIKGTQVTLC